MKERPVRPSIISTTAAERGQAVVETIFLLPILFAFVLIILQAFFMIHRTQVSQKYLKQAVIGMAGNRFDLSKSLFADAKTRATKKGSAKVFSYVVDEISLGSFKMMSYRFSVPAMLRWVIPDTPSFIKREFDDLEKNGRPGRQAMGICTGGYGNAGGIKVSPAVFSDNNVAKTAWTCNNM
jgi:hypothetical protein